MANPATFKAIRAANQEYRRCGRVPGKFIDTGTHLARFEALERLHWASFSYRRFKTIANKAELASILAEIRLSLHTLRMAACPLIP